jgi:hypothetical protein
MIAERAECGGSAPARLALKRAEHKGCARCPLGAFRMPKVKQGRRRVAVQADEECHPTLPQQRRDRWRRGAAIGIFATAAIGIFATAAISIFATATFGIFATATFGIFATEVFTCPVCTSHRACSAHAPDASCRLRHCRCLRGSL